MLLASRWSPHACIVVPLLCSFVLLVLLCIALLLLALVCLLPPTSCFGCPCVLVSILNILHWEFSVTGARGRWPVGCCHAYPLYLHFAQTHSVIACFAVSWHVPTIFNIAYWLAKPALVCRLFTNMHFVFGEKLLLISTISRGEFLSTTTHNGNKT